MLLELSCDAFKSYGEIRKNIVFHEGLNAVVGGKRGANSIGKSTFLMLIDFAFGGDDYIVDNITDIKEVGPHTVKFAFQTEQGIKYFSRSTQTPYNVNICDENYEVLRTINIQKYRKTLLDIYGISIPDTSFRDMVANFIRVHPRTPSKLIESPLQAAMGQSRAEQIIKFEKIFKSYKEINALKKAYDEFDSQLKTLSNAGKYNFIKAAPNVTAFKRNQDIIKNLRLKIEELRDESAKDLLTTKAVKDDSTRELITVINNLKDKKGFLHSQIRAIERNQDLKVKVKKQNFEQLQKFFPNLNVEYLDQVEHFHKNLVNILNKEFKDSIKELQDQLSIINETISGLEDKVKEVNQSPAINMVLIEKIGRYDNEIQNLKNSNDLFLQSKELKKKKSESKGQWDKAVKKGLDISQNNVNQAMRDMNIEVCGNSEVSPPVLNIRDGKHYTFNTSADTGTGSEYKGTILFDLSCLRLSELPFLIHDSLMFSNIEVDRVQNIIKLYNKQIKQVFIAIDKVDELDPDIQEIIKSNQVLKLDRGGNELFGRTLGVKNKRGE